MYDKDALTSSLYCCCEICDVVPSMYYTDTFAALKPARTFTPQYCADDGNWMEVDEVWLAGEDHDGEHLSDEEYFAVKK
jgi:hypothetical protein